MNAWRTKWAALGVLGMAAAGAAGGPGRAPEGAAQAPTTQPAAAGGAQRVTRGREQPAGPQAMVPGGIALPVARITDTPKNVPPGTRIRAGSQRPQGRYSLAKGVANVARGKPVTSTDSDPVIGTLKLVTDGDKEASEDAYVELGPGTQWVQIDLDKAYPIAAVAVWHEHKNPIVYHDVIIRIADDKDFTRNVRTVFNNDHDNSSELGIGADWGYFETNEGLVVKLKDLRARYVRLYSNGSTADDLNRYTEVEVYAPAK